MQLTQNGILVEKPRISSIDIIRGLVMVIMVLDHVRHFMHADALLYEPTDLSKTTPALFFVRWITHFCAPAFVLLAGMAIRISSKRKSVRDLRAFLFTRGLWLLFLEVIVMRFSFFFSWYFDLIVFQVIWAIGASMILSAALIQLREKYIALIAILIIAGHNGLQYFTVNETHPLFIPWTLFFQPGYFSLGEASGIQVIYPVMPWLGVLLLGYVTGRWFSRDLNEIRPSYLYITGTAMIIGFIGLRYLNVYGDPTPWTVGQSTVFTLLSFLNCEKYPPSLLYILMTLGPVFIMLGVTESISTQLVKPLLIFGRVPLFFYIIHFFMIHIAALGIYMYQTGKSWSEIDFHASASFGGITPGSGLSLPYVLAAWAGFVIILYPLCLWYSGVKTRSTHWLVSYV